LFYFFVSRVFAATIKRPFGVRYNPYTQSVEILSNTAKIMALVSELRGDLCIVTNALQKIRKEDALSEQDEDAADIQQQLLAQQLESLSRRNSDTCPTRETVALVSNGEALLQQQQQQYLQPTCQSLATAAKVEPEVKVGTDSHATGDLCSNKSEPNETFHPQPDNNDPGKHLKQITIKDESTGSAGDNLAGTTGNCVDKPAADSIKTVISDGHLETSEKTAGDKPTAGDNAMKRLNEDGGHAANTSDDGLSGAGDIAPEAKGEQTVVRHEMAANLANEPTLPGQRNETATTNTEKTADTEQGCRQGQGTGDWNVGSSVSPPTQLLQSHHV
jgi:hypothetical protein